MSADDVCCVCSKSAQSNKEDPRGLTELRPYGPKGAPICFACAMKPENRDETDLQFGRALDAAEDVSRADGARIAHVELTPHGPRGIKTKHVMQKPTMRHDFSPEKFPITIQLYSNKTDTLVWSQTVTLDEAQALAKIEIPSFKDTEHYPVRAEITFADGTTSAGGMQ